MNIYFFMYVASVIVSCTWGVIFFRYYKNISWFFFLLFTLFSSLWFILFYLFFNNSDPWFLIVLSRVDFALSILAIYSFVLFVLFFQSSRWDFSFKSLILPTIAAVSILLLYGSTDLIIHSLSPDKFWVFREITGDFYFIHIILSFFSLPLIVFYTRKQFRIQSYITKIRLKRIIISASLLILAMIFFQLVLPLFGIWIFEKEIIILFTLFVVYVVFTMKRYYFTLIHQEYGILKLIAILLSFILSVFLLNVIRNFYLDTVFHGNPFWNTWDIFGIVNSTILIVVYISMYNLFKKLFWIDRGDQGLKISIDILKQTLSNATTTEQLDRILWGGIRNIFKTNLSKVVFINHPEEYAELQKYFLNPLSEKLFINDIVFIEENKTKFNKEIILREIHRETMLIFPIRNSEWVVFGLYFLWKKPLWDFYTVIEIQYLLSLTRFLWLHLKYLATYKKIQDYSLQLDKRIDDKTIEYNDLINKQKEFISMISHEIRSPIWSTVFQVDAIIDEVHKWKLSMNDIENKIRDLSDQLVRVGELLKKLFSVQYFDTRNVVLLKEKIHIWTLLEKEFDIYSRMHQNIKFIKNIPADVWFASIDKVHFHQVLTNLIDNAMKFADESNPVILIECYLVDNKYICIRIEDNWSWYWSIDPSVIFDKYTTGNHAKLWLGMWLFLCKKIIDMHNGTIVASNGKILSGASFLIKIPI